MEILVTGGELLATVLLLSLLQPECQQSYELQFLRPMKDWCVS
jgi:hypothetical protein